MTVFDITRMHDTKSLAFLDPKGGVAIQRYDTMKYRQFDKLTDKQLSFFWRPEEVDITKDSGDFKSLNEHEKHIFTSNLKRQILLDSVQGRSPSQAFGTIVSLPEIEAFVQTWAFNETLHSRSYTHIIRNVYPDPAVIFDAVLSIPEIVDCAKDISKDYDNLIEMVGWYNLLGVGTHTVNGKTVVVDLYEMKRAIWLALMSVNILEGIRFYVSFACSWAFAEIKKLEGNAKIIKFICRDENVHLAFTQSLIKILPKDDPDFIKIAEETREACIEMFRAAAEQEKQWAKFLFKDGSIIGLNYQLLSDYVEWITNKRLTGVGLPTIYKTGSNPLPWTLKWIAGSEVQTAPQEVEISSYTIGETVQDVTDDTFKGFSL